MMEIPRPRRWRPYFEMSDSVSLLMPAFCKAQAEFDPIVRDREENVLLPGSNSKTRVRRFASASSILRSCKPALLKNGVTPITVYSQSDEGCQQVSSVWFKDQYIASVLIVDRGTYIREFCGRAEQLRKYSLQHLFCVAPDDDDDGVEADSNAEAGEALSEQTKEYHEANLKAALAAIAGCQTEQKLHDILRHAEKKLNEGKLSVDNMRTIEEAVTLRKQSMNGGSND